MKKKYIVAHIIALIALFCVPISEGNIIGRSPSDEAVFVALTTLLPTLVGLGLIKFFVLPLIIAGMIVNGFIRKERLENPMNVLLRAVLVICYFAFLTNIHSIYKKDFLKDFQDHMRVNQVLYKFNYQKFERDSMPIKVDSLNEAELIQRHHRAERYNYSEKDTGVNGGEKRYQIYLSAINEEPFQYTMEDYFNAFATPMKKIGLHFDSTRYVGAIKSEEIPGLPFAYGVVTFKLKCFLGIESNCLCQDTKRDVGYFGHFIMIRFISKDLLLFEVEYLLCLVLVIFYLALLIYRLLQNGHVARKSLFWDEEQETIKE